MPATVSEVMDQMLKHRPDTTLAASRQMVPRAVRAVAPQRVRRAPEAAPARPRVARALDESVIPLPLQPPHSAQAGHREAGKVARLGA